MAETLTDGSKVYHISLCPDRNAGGVIIECVDWNHAFKLFNQLVEATEIYSVEP
jgi:hypothetical protein